MNVIADHLSRYPIRLNLDEAAKEGKRESALWTDQTLLPHAIEMFDSEPESTWSVTAEDQSHERTQSRDP